MIRPTLERVYLVEGKAGTYEPSFWTVNAWTTRELAEAEAARMAPLAKQFWAELAEYEKRVKDDLSEEELGPYFDGRDALIAKWETIVGDDKVSHLDESEYYVSEVAVKA